MARTCGACRLPVRWDEGLLATWMDDGPRGPGHYVACPRCRSSAEGAQPPAKYPPGEVPRHPTRDCDLPICGLCREALFEGERTVPMRLVGEDVSAAGRPEVEPGVYCACPRCLETWRPTIRDRLAREGVIAGGVRAEALSGSALL